MNSPLRTALVLLLLAATGGCTSISGESRPPDIVVILLDDLGYSDIGYLGSEIETPGIDNLAANGLTVTNFYVHPRCSPTRASLLTGRSPHESGLGFLTTPASANPPPGPFQGYLSPDVPMLQELLKASGYHTYMSGKWHLGEKPAYWPDRRGFDQSFGLISGASSYYELITDQPMKRQMALNGEPWTPPEDGFYMTDAITTRALKYLERHEQQHGDEPYFLYLAYTAPHWPLHALEEDIASYRGKYDAGAEAVAAGRLAGIAARQFSLPDEVHPWSSQSTQAWARRMEVYAAQVTAADRGIGQLVEQLKTTNRLENTLILFLSDNGATKEDITRRGLHQPGIPVGERGSYLSYGADWARVSNTPFHEFKGSTHEGGIRSPLILHWPAAILQASIDQENIVDVADLMPTLLALADTRIPAGVRGQDVSSLISGRTIERDNPVFREHLGWKAVRDGRWKAVFDPYQKKWMLYDLQEDPAEVRDIAGQKPEHLAMMVESWQQWSDEVGTDGFDIGAFMKYYGL